MFNWPNFLYLFTHALPILIGIATFIGITVLLEFLGIDFSLDSEVYPHSILGEYGYTLALIGAIITGVSANSYFNSKRR